MSDMTEERLQFIEARLVHLSSANQKDRLAQVNNLVEDVTALVAEVRLCWRGAVADEKAIELLNAELDRVRAKQEH